MAEVEKEKQIPPYVPWKTLKTFIRSLGQALPPRIDKSMMSSMSGSTQAQVLHALKALKLIDSQGVPTARLREMVNTVAQEDKFRPVLLDVINSSYPFVRGGFDLKSATAQMFVEEFEKMGATGGTVPKCIAFFLPAAKEAGIELSPYIEKGGARPSRTGPSRKRKGSAADSLGANGGGGAQLPPNTITSTEQPSPLMKALLDKFPNFDPAWPDDLKKSWFTAFDDLMKRSGGTK